MDPSTTGVNIKAFAFHDIETLSDKPSRRLKHLLSLNHVRYSILYNNLRFHNHSPHFLGSAYLLGSSAEHLESIYDDNVDRDMLEPWKSSPGEITLDGYRAYLSKGEYQRAWVDFFADQIAALDHSGKWQGAVMKFLLDAGPSEDVNSAPILHCLTAGLGHPLIHLGYAFELNSQELAAEALGLAATCYDTQLTSLLTKTSPSTTEPTSDLFKLFLRVHNDKSLPIFPHVGDQNLPPILSSQEHLNTIISHLNSWSISTNPTSSFSQIQHLASLVLISTSPQLGGHGYDFFLVHLLTTSYAVRILLQNLPAHHHVTLLREWLLMALLVYVAQNRPKLVSAYITEFELQEGRDWEFVRKRALEGEHATDAHFVKACRGLMAGAETWGEDEEEWFLKCAVRFVEEFEAWGGFRPDGEEAEKKRRERLRDGIHVL